MNRWKRAPAMTLLLVLIAATACLRGGADSAVLEIRASEYGFGIESKPIDPGLVTIVFRNEGAEPHQAQIARLKDGVPAEALRAALARGEDETFFSSVVLVGGPTGVPAGGEEVTYSTLTPGAYMVFCFFPTPDGQHAHVAKGMIGTFKVRGGDAEPARPATAGRIDIADFRIAVPDGFTGNGTYAVHNAGPQAHEVTFVRLEPGASVADVLASFEGKAEARSRFAWAGGVAAIATGDTAWVGLALRPGRYAAFCLVPDAHGKGPHAGLGMVTEFTVT